MPISFGGKAKEEDVVSLIAAKKYARAIEALKAQLRRRGANPSLLMQLADVLILADKKKEAVALLLPLADQYANDGFAAKAVSVLKKVQRIDPGRREVDTRLARLIEEKQREAVVAPSRTPLIGIEEPAEASALAAGAGADGPALEIGFEAMAPMSSPAASAPPPPPPSLAPPTIVPPPPSAPAAGEIEDYDLLYSDEDEEVTLEGEIVEEDPPATEPMSAGQFADELMGLVDSVFQEFAGTPLPSPASAGPPPAQGRQIVVSPLFRDFSVDEMVAVIEGLKLLSFERGGVILKEGQPGTSLYMLTSGRVRAFRRNRATGAQDVLGDLEEGAFFGEVSILTGRPRMASVVALTRCELLELDRGALDGITKTHPHVWDVLREFAKQRAG